MRVPPHDRIGEAFASFATNSIDTFLDRAASQNPLEIALKLFRGVVHDVPAYGRFLASQGVDPTTIATHDDFARLPLTTKENYVRRYPIADLCHGGRLETCDMIAVSSGSTGEPTVWPRFQTDEFAIAQRFEQVFADSFDAGRKRTLALVCFPLGTWVGGMFTAACLRHLAAKGYAMTVATPGNQKAEIFRVLRAMGPLFEQTVLLGYPPFLKDVVDAGITEGLDWKSLRIKLVMAGEVFSEDWRTLMAERAGLTRMVFDSASLYGTADAGVLGNETPLSIAIRRYLAEHPDDAGALFGSQRLPTLVQYDPTQRYFECVDGSLIFSGDNGVPLIRYQISDAGGVVPFQTMMDRMAACGFDADQALGAEPTARIRRLPFAYVFGRSHFALSFYGANIFPETVAIGLEQPSVRAWVTGKFVMEIVQNLDRDGVFCVAVELAQGVEASDEMRDAIAASILTHLLRQNSEFANYVPEGRRSPRVGLRPLGDPEYFPAGVKHRYSRR